MERGIVTQLAAGRRIVSLEHTRARTNGEVGIAWRDGHVIAICAHACKLETLPSLAALAQLERLDVGDNQLTELPALPASLRELYVHDNQLRLLGGLPRLTVLDANRNRLVNIPVLDDIGFVYLAANQLTRLPPITGVRYLNIGENPLGELAIRNPDLVELRAENAGLASATIDAPALRELALRGNHLETITLATPRLEALDLRANRFDTLPCTLRTLPLRKLDLRWNPLRALPAWIDELGGMVYA